jgi:hypothetical protein
MLRLAYSLVVLRARSLAEIGGLAFSPISVKRADRLCARPLADRPRCPWRRIRMSCAVAPPRPTRSDSAGCAQLNRASPPGPSQTPRWPAQELLRSWSNLLSRLTGSSAVAADQAKRLSRDNQLRLGAQFLQAASSLAGAGWQFRATRHPDMRIPGRTRFLRRPHSRMRTLQPQCSPGRPSLATVIFNPAVKAGSKDHRGTCCLPGWLIGLAGRVRK